MSYLRPETGDRDDGIIEGRERQPTQRSEVEIRM